ncbi:MAG: hypothetical protein JO234_05040 [Hyphomicrobiales bacterium]|nr:hypothetical protein [Hyphomicrobiales bacterium]
MQRSQLRAAVRAIAVRAPSRLANNHLSSAILVLGAMLAATAAILSANAIRLGGAPQRLAPSTIESFTPSHAGCRLPWPHPPRQFPMC